MPSKSSIEKVEAGTRSANRLPILIAICRELRIDLPVLIGREPTRDTRECINDIQAEAIRSSLERYDAIRNQIPDDYSADILVCVLRSVTHGQPLSWRTITSLAGPCPISCSMRNAAM